MLTHLVGHSPTGAASLELVKAGESWRLTSAGHRELERATVFRFNHFISEISSLVKLETKRMQKCEATEDIASHKPEQFNFAVHHCFLL